jgi:hypothetical protein
MPWHCWWQCAFPRRERRLYRAVATALWVTTIAGGSAFAAAQVRGNAGADDHETVETEDLFGFVEGADIGRVGQREVEIDSTLRSGKSTGTFDAAASQFEFKYTAFKDFRISANATLAYYDIAGVTGMDDMRRAAVQSLSFDARFRLLDRDRGPFGLTLSFEPHWGFVDETSGVPLNHFGWQGLMLADRELVPNRVVGAINVLFDTDRTRLLPDHVVEQEPMLGVGAAVALQVMPGLWLGGETRYLRSYSGAALDVFSGQALYAGPTLYARVGRNGWLSAAFDLQVWGGAVGVPGALDLVNFERYQAKFRAGVEF